MKLGWPRRSLTEGLLGPRRALIPVGAGAAGLDGGAVVEAGLVLGPRRALIPVGAGTAGLDGGAVVEAGLVLDGGTLLELDCEHGY